MTYRSHRLLRSVHRLRCDRFSVAENAATYEPFVECRAFDGVMRHVQGDGYVDPEARYDATLRVVEAVESVVVAELLPSGVAGRLASAVAGVAFADRVREDGRHSLGGADHYVAEGCAALAQAAVLDRVFRAFGEVMRRRALVDHRDDPCWPAAYLRRSAETEDARLGLSGGDDDSRSDEGVFEPPLSP